MGESSRYFTDIRREQVSVGYLQKDALLDPSDVRSTLWASLLLLTLAGQENPVFDRQNFEERLEEIISQFDWLKNEKAEYLTRFGRSNNEGRGKTNQSVMLSLFAQANNFLSLKDDESFLTSLISTGSFNSLLRKEGEERFSSDGELFYLHHPTPGTDGRGNVADSPNGRRHQILSGLIDALFISYSMRTEFSKASNLMESFVREYIAIRGGEFKHYLYIPLQAMRAGRALLNDQDARGWAAEAALQEELYKNLKEEYGIYVAVAYMQGVSEFAAECGIFWAAGEGLKWGGQGISKLWVKYVPKRTRVLLRKNIVDPIRRLRGKPSRAQLMSGRRIRTDIAREKSALQIQRRLGDLTEEEFLRYWDMLQQEQARELLLHGLTP